MLECYTHVPCSEDASANYSAESPPNYQEVNWIHLLDWNRSIFIACLPSSYNHPLKFTIYLKEPNSLPPTHSYNPRPHLPFPGGRNPLVIEPVSPAILISPLPFSYLSNKPIYHIYFFVSWEFSLCMWVRSLKKHDRSKPYTYSMQSW